MSDRVVKILKQVKLTAPSCYTEIAVTEQGFFRVRSYKTFKAKVTYSENYGKVSRHVHEAGEKIQSGCAFPFSTIEEAEELFRRWSDGKIKSVCRKFKIFSPFF